MIPRAFFAPALIAASAVLIRFLPGHMVPLCGMRRWFGLPCPTCGAYRAGRALIEGRVLDAVRLQPLGIIVLPVLGVYTLYALAVICLKAPRLRVESVSTRDRRVIGWAMAGVLLANWVYLLRAGI